MHHHTEQEWQFAARELESARNWLAAQPQNPSERRFASRPTLSMRDTYYDSPDWMIFRAGFALRVREARRADGAGDGESEITLKSLHRAHHGLARRTEISESMGTSDLDAVLARADGIGGQIRSLVGTRTLTPLFQASTRRERQQLLEADTDLALAEIDLDETSIESVSGPARELRRVEVECINAEPAAVSALVEQLRTAAHLEPVEMSKFRAGLAAAGLDPPAPQDRVALELSPSQPFADAQLVVLRRYFEAVIEKEAAVRMGSAQALHEMRVAARHLEVLLRMFRGSGPRWAVSARGRVRKLMDRLGAVRDCDVQLAYLDAERDTLADTDREAFEPIRARLAARQAKARNRLLQALDSPALRHWMQDWERHLRAATPGSTRAQRASTAEVARELILDAARKLRKRARRIDEKSTPDDYHEVRIRAKRLRYLVDAFASLYGESATSYVQALARLQSVLGDYHDATVREQRFTELVTQGPRLPAPTSFLAGRLVERDARAFERCRGKFAKAYRRVRRRRWRELDATMKRVAQSVSEPASPVAA
jgi:triphosphatase